VSTGSPGGRRAPVDRRLALVLAGMMVGLFLTELDQTVFATALPTVVGDLGAVAGLFWVNTAYLLTGTLAMPVHGKLGDLLGRKPVYVGALLVFLAGSVLGGLAPDLPTLVLARAVQGLGGGGLLVGVQAIVAELCAPRERARVLSFVGAVFAASSVLGPVLGGWLADGPGWRWIFWLNLPLGGLAVVAAVRLLDLPRRPDVAVRVDVWGITTLSVAVTALVLVASWGGTAAAWRSPYVPGLVLLLGAAVWAFLLAERRAAEPLIPLRLFADPAFTVPTLSALVLAVTTFGTIAYLPTYLQMGLGLSPRHAGLAMLALIAGLGTATVVAGQLVARTGRQRPLPVAGGLLVAAGLAGLAATGAGASLPVVLGWLLVLGLGVGAGLQLVVVVAQNAAPPSQLGAATAAVSFFREVGVVLGTAAVGAAFTARLTAGLAERLPPELEPASLSPERLATLSPGVRAEVGAVYADAFVPLLGWLVPLVLLSTAALLVVRPVPLPDLGEPDADSAGPASLTRGG
jgi:EmrB/QacA subfamily drug resistance transporter